MKDFLKKFLGAEKLAEIEQAYATAYPESKGLPIYISKTRLDEVLGQKKKAEDDLAFKDTEIATLRETHDKAIGDLEAKAKTDYEELLKAETNKLTMDFQVTEAIYKAKGRNITAIRALVDPAKKVDEEIARLQKEESYLFEDGIPGGTGKQGDDGEGADRLAESMRKAVGL